MTAETSTGRRSLLVPITFVISVVIRWALTDHIVDIRAAGDATQYIELTQNLMSGRGLLTSHPNYGSMQGTFPPLYPLMLSAPSLVFGLNKWVVLAFNTAIDFATAWCIAGVGARLEIGRVGRIAAAAYLLWPDVLLSSMFAQKEGLASLLSTLICYCYATVEVRAVRDSYAAAALGAATALLALTQPALITLPACLAAVWLPRTGVRRIGLFALYAVPTFVAVMAPWWYRNYQLFHAFVPLTLATGMGLRWVMIGAHQAYPPSVLNQPELARASYAMTEALQLFQRSPGTYFSHVASNATGAMFRDDAATDRYGLHSLWATRAIWLMLISLYALGLSWFSRFTKSPLSLLLAGCLLQVFVQLWFEFGERHRYFVVPLLLLAAAGVVSSAWSRPNRRRRSLAEAEPTGTFSLPSATDTE